MSGGRHGYDGHHGPDHVAPMNTSGLADAGPTVDELREEWLAKVEVAEGLTSEVQEYAVLIARAIAGGMIVRDTRVDEFRRADDRAKGAWVSARDAQAAFDQARSAAAQVPA